MRLILVDQPTPKRRNFYPLALSRPIWELRCGITSLAEKLVTRLRPAEVACFVPPYMADVYRARTTWPVNDPKALKGNDLLLVNGRVKAAEFSLPSAGPSRVVLDADGELLAARINQNDLGKLQNGSIDALLNSAKQTLPAGPAIDLPAWNYTWDLILANPAQLIDDFRAAGCSGIEGTVEQPNAIRGRAGDVYVARGAKIHPMVVLDAEHGPIYIDEDVEIHPFTRVEGPCYIGRKSILLGAKCREGMSIGPMCRVGGEVEESIIQGYSNKYHDGFLGHAYVGEWVNLGALTTNSDLKNDYSSVSVILDGRTPVSTGSTKVGSLIGDHTKTSIATLLNTGAYVGAMAVLMGTGKPLPKFIPSFAWFLEGAVTKGFGKTQIYNTAKIAMSRRKCQWTEADAALWDEVFKLTAPERDEAIKKGRRAMAG
jgi:UDP-N-acetylglucosamine diphosphorylase / glucose-1-phosphate thymidylyltransferase / UDP-N-acetylgalactosamine diphosphorylase / glucosamine-1-phosphate N-acetyltransferase / galactosamine-1-phosphate N-acetyltransferase